MVPQSSCVGVVYSDASDTGFGGYLVKCGKHEVAGSWDIHQLSFISTLKELLAVKYVLISLIDKLSGFSLKWFTDNKNVALILNIKKPHLQHEILQIFNICYPRSIRIDIEWIPRAGNEQSDYLSKLYDDNDWGISDTLFCYLETNWGLHTIDRLANYLNTKLPRFNSKYWNPGSESIDSFICDSEHDNNYLCPPIPLIPIECYVMQKTVWLKEHWFYLFGLQPHFGHYFSQIHVKASLISSKKLCFFLLAKNTTRPEHVTVYLGEKI